MKTTDLKKQMNDQPVVSPIKGKNVLEVMQEL